MHVRHSVAILFALMTPVAASAQTMYSTDCWNCFYANRTAIDFCGDHVCRLSIALTSGSPAVDAAKEACDRHMVARGVVTINGVTQPSASDLLELDPAWPKCKVVMERWHAATDVIAANMKARRDADDVARKKAQDEADRKTIDAAVP